MQKSVVFPYAKNKISWKKKTKNKESYPIQNSTNNNEILRNKFNQKDLYNENYKALVRKIGEDTFKLI